MHHLYESGEFKSFERLQAEWGVPHSWYVRYVKLKHAAMAQYCLRGVSFSDSKLQTLLLQPDHRPNYQLLLCVNSY